MMRQWLEDVWNAPRAEFEWFMGVLWGQFLYVAITLLILYWLWMKIRGAKK